MRDGTDSWERGRRNRQEVNANVRIIEEKGRERREVCVELHAVEIDECVAGSKLLFYIFCALYFQRAFRVMHETLA